MDRELSAPRSGEEPPPPGPDEYRVSRSHILIALVAGIMVPLGFEPWGLSLLMPFSFMLLALVTDRCGFRKSLLFGWFFGLGVQGASLPWIALAAKNYIGIFVLGDPGSTTAWLAGIGLFLLWWPLSSLGWGICLALISLAPDAPGTRQRIWRCLGIVIFVALYEAWWPRLFPWSIGSGLASTEPSVAWILLRQWGVEVASLVIAGSGFLAAHTFPLVFNFFDGNKRIQVWSRVWLMLPCLLVALLTILPLTSDESSISTDGDRKGVIVSLIQPAMPLEMRHGQSAPIIDRQIKQLIEEAQNSLPADFCDDELIVLPEAALPGVHDSRSLQLWAGSWLQKPLLGGVLHHSAEGYSNAVALISPSSGDQNQPLPQVEIGFKKELVPFGEVIPGEPIFEALGWKPPITSMVAGEDPILFKTKNEREPFGVSICYEGLLPGISSGLQSRGALWHVNVTEDLWYGNYVEPAQHLQLQRSRSIESGLPLLRCTNAGHTVAFDPRSHGSRTLIASRRWYPQQGWTSWQSWNVSGEVSLAAEVGVRGILQVRLMGDPDLQKGPYLGWPQGWAPILGAIWVGAGIWRRFRRPLPAEIRNS